MEYNVEDIINRIQQVMKIKKNSEMSEAFNIAANSISRWKSTNNINLNLVYKFALKNSVSFMWLITGLEENKLRDSKYEFVKDIINHIDYGRENNISEQDMLNLIAHEINVHKLKFELTKKNNLD